MAPYPPHLPENSRDSYSVACPSNRRPSVSDGDVYGAGRGLQPISFAKMVFRVPRGERLEEADRLSLVVTSGLEPFCLVKSVAIRGQFGGSEEDEEERSTDSE